MKAVYAKCRKHPAAMLFLACLLALAFCACAVWKLADNQKASELINTFEEKQLLNELVVDRLSDENNTGIQIYIGDETPVKTMKDCSVVTATYELEEGMKGTIGIIGPKRMDYDKVVGTLKTLMHQLDELYNKKE